MWEITDWAASQPAERQELPGAVQNEKWKAF